MSKLFFDKIDYNKVLLESKNFIVIPSLGSLVEGWLLIIPKQFHINLSQLDQRHMEDLQDLIRRIESRVLPKFGEKYVLFEHGPQNFKSKTGCGVDYAHLHFVPFGHDLKKGLKSFLHLEYDWQELENISDLTNYKNSKKDYLLLLDQNGKASITFQENILSQTFRRVIANYLGKPNEFDWKCNFKEDNIHSTIDKLEYSEI